MAGEPTRRPDSVGDGSSRVRPEQPSISARRCRRARATYPQTRAGRPLGAEAPASARTPEPWLRRPSWSCSRWGLPSRLGRPTRWWSLTPPFHPYPHPDRSRGRWRSVSVALSRESPRVGVTHHLALRSPDLPRPAGVVRRSLTAATRSARPQPVAYPARAAGAVAHSFALPVPGRCRTARAWTPCPTRTLRGGDQRLMCRRAAVRGMRGRLVSRDGRSALEPASAAQAAHIACAAAEGPPGPGSTWSDGASTRPMPSWRTPVRPGSSPWMDLAAALSTHRVRGGTDIRLSLSSTLSRVGLTARGALRPGRGATPRPATVDTSAERRRTTSTFCQYLDFCLPRSHLTGLRRARSAPGGQSGRPRRAAPAPRVPAGASGPVPLSPAPPQQAAG